MENEEITGTMRCDGDNDPVSEFIGMHYPIFIFFKSNCNIISFFSTLQRNDNLSF